MASVVKEITTRPCDDLSESCWSVEFGLRSHFMDSEPHPFPPRSAFCVGASPPGVCWALSRRGAGKIRQDVTRSEILSHINVNHW